MATFKSEIIRQQIQGGNVSEKDMFSSVLLSSR